MDVIITGKIPGAQWCFLAALILSGYYSLPTLTNHRSATGIAVSLRIIPTSLAPQPDEVRFQFDCDDGRVIQCSITDDALRDLIDFHRVKNTDEDTSRVLLPEVERLANAKYDARRLEEDGGLLIRPADLVRYGFEKRKKRAA